MREKAGIRTNTGRANGAPFLSPGYSHWKNGVHMIVGQPHLALRNKSDLTAPL